MMLYTLLLFGPPAATIGKDRLQIEMPQRCTSDELLAKIAELHPSLHDALKVGRLAVENRFVQGDAVIEPGAEIALITMVSGG